MAAGDDTQRDQPNGSATASEQKRAAAPADPSRKPATLVFPLSIGTLPVGKSVTVVFRAVISNPFTGALPSVSNQGSISGSGFGPVLTDDPATVAVDDPTVTPIDLRPDLSLTKSDGGAAVAPGGTVAYTLGYANLSSFGATGVTLTETVPANTTFNAGASTAGWVCTPNGNAGSSCTLSLGTVAGSGSGSATFALTVVNPVAAGVTQISNTASIASTLPDPVPGNNTASDTTPVTAAPDLTLAKSDGGASVAPGGTVAYTLAYANSGNQGATGIVLTETVPANTTFNAGASTAGWICTPNGNAGSSCTLAIGALNGGGANGTATFALTVVNPVAAGVAQISNTASVADDGANGADPTPANNSASDTTPVTAAPDLALTKSDGGVSTTPGGTVAYTLSYSNGGNQSASGVALTETVPANTTFNAGASSAGWVCTPNNNAGSTCTLAIGALSGGGANGTATFAVTVVNPVPAGVTQISNTASIADDAANGSDPTPGNNTGSDTTPVTATPDLTLTKSDGGVSTTPGGTVAYTLSYSNAGNQGAAGVVLSETVPTNTTFNAGASTAGWVCTPNGNAGSTCTLALGALSGGGTSGSATFAVTVVNPIPGGVTQISNTASIADDGNNGADPTPGNNTSTDTTPLVLVPDVTIGEVVHGFSLVESLAALAGPVADEDVYRIGQMPYSSYEVVIDATAGDIGAGNGPVLERVAADGTTVLQSSVAVGAGSSRSLRFANATSTANTLETIRVRSAGCTTACGPETQYRIRAYETTYSIERFNNIAPQLTVLLVQNSGDVSVNGTVWLWNAAGAPIGQQAFTLPARGVLVLNTMSLAPGISGSVTVSSDGAYGILAGKAAVLDPSAGPAQDVIMRPRAR